MRKIKQKKSKLNLVLNSLKPHVSDPTLLDGKFIILDFEVSRNNVIVSKEVALESLAPSIINKPIRGHYIEEENDFGGHEAYIKETSDGEQIFERNTIPMGVFTSEGYIEEIEINGELKEVLVADAVLWYSQFKQPIDLLVDWFEQGITISMSCEYLFSNYKVLDGVEIHEKPLFLESHCILGNSIEPAYESAKLIDYTQLNQFKQLVAQAVNQEKDKEDVKLEEVKDDVVVEEVETEETQVVETVKVDTEEVDVVESEEEKEVKSQLNELSHDGIRDQIRQQVTASLTEEGYAWVAEVYETYAILEVDEPTTYKYYQYEYTVSDEVVNVDIASKKEVQSRTEWVEVNELVQAELNTVKSEKDELTVKLNEANEKIISLNSDIESLKPFQEQMLNAKKNEKLAELTDKFSKAFNNAGAKEKFESEEVQTLLNEAIESAEAVSQLNAMVVDLIMNATKEDSGEVLLGLNSVRKDLVKQELDDFESKFKI